MSGILKTLESFGRTTVEGIMLPLLQPDLYAGAVALALASMLVVVPAYFFDVDVGEANLGLPAVAFLYVYCHTHANRRAAKQPPPRGPAVEEDPSVDLDALLDAARVVDGTPLAERPGLRAVVVLHTDSAAPSKAKPAPAQLESVVSRYCNTPGLAFVKAARAEGAGSAATAAPGKRPAPADQRTQPLVLAGAGKLLDEGRGKPLFVLEVEARRATLRWNGHHAATLEKLLLQLFPLGDSSEEEPGPAPMPTE